MSIEVENARVYTGRKVIKTDADVIDESNLIDELTNALAIHRQNRADIQYLYDYYRGKQDILYKTKTVREEINNKVTVNMAYQIVTFKVGYLAGEPIQYISTEDAENVDKIMEELDKLNKAMYSIGKHKLDKDLIEWMMICGTSYRYISSEKMEDVPFNLYTLDPRDTAIVYSTGIKREPKFAFSSYTKEDNIVRVPAVNPGQYSMEVYEVFTDKMYYKVEDGKIVEKKPHYLGYIPIIEYPANNARLGSFEVVLPLLDMLNKAYSDRMDATEQFVQSFMKFVNCSMDEDDLRKIKDFGAVMIKSDNNLPADVDLITSEMDQNQTETMIESVDMKILTITGLPNRSGGTGSTSDTGKATIYRDGFNDALSRARETETNFKASEIAMLRILFKLCEANNFCSLKTKDVEANFTIHNYDDIQSKAQVLIALLQNAKVHPKLAFTASGLFVDSESAYKMSMEYYEEEMKKMEEKMSMNANNGEEIEEQGSSKNAKEEKQISNPVEKFADNSNAQRVNS